MDKAKGCDMLREGKAFSTFSVDDTEAAHVFYRDTLGLDVREDSGMLYLHLAGGGEPVMLYPKSNHTPATYTALNFPVADLRATMDALRARGVRFEAYHDAIVSTDEHGVFHYEGLMQAWFKDPAGNILSLIQFSEV